MPIIIYYVLVLLLLTYMYFCLKCVGHELCYYYVNDVIVSVFNLNCLIGKETAVSLITQFKTDNEEIILKFKFHYIIATFRNSLVSSSGN